MSRSEYAFCNPESQFARMPVYHLEAAILRSVPSFRASRKIVPEDDPDRVADEVITKGFDEFCWSLYFEPAFLIRLFFAGFLPICTDLGAPGDPVYCLLPKLHFQRSVISLTNWEGRKVRRKNNRSYELCLDQQFDSVIAGCMQQHGARSWIHPPLLKALRDLHFFGSCICPNSCPVRVHSVGLVRNGELVAGEIGCTVGSVYTSMTGFYRESGTGSIQLALLGQHLKARGFALWDLGMQMDYKTDLGAVCMSRVDFLHAFRRHSVHSFPRMSLCVVLDMDVRWWSPSRFRTVVDSVKFFVGVLGLSLSSEMPLCVIACFHEKAEYVISDLDWRSIAQLDLALESLMKQHEGDESKSQVFETPLAQGVSLAISFAHKLKHPRNQIILFECSREMTDFSSQTVGLSNCGWACKDWARTHLVSLVSATPSAALLSLCSKSEGVHIPSQFTSGQGELIQALLFHLASSGNASLKTRPQIQRAHMGAVCACHNKPLDKGYVCSICLAIYCSETAGICAICGSRIRREAKDEQPIFAQTFSKLFPGAL